MNNALIIGYGNPLRSDDGFGWHASRLLAQALAGQDVGAPLVGALEWAGTRPAPTTVEIITCHQLTPELAEPLSQSAARCLSTPTLRVSRGISVAEPSARRSPLHPRLPTVARRRGCSPAPKRCMATARRRSSSQFQHSLLLLEIHYRQPFPRPSRRSWTRSAGRSEIRGPRG